MCYNSNYRGGNTMVELKDRLKELRKESDLKQSEVAEALDIGRTTYSNYEQGLRSPRKDKLIKIANYFGVSVDYLLGLTDEKQTANKIAEEIADNPELMEFYKSFKENNELKRLFNHSKGLSSKSIKQIVEIIKTFEETEQD